MAQLGTIPVYLRVGTGSEFRLGDLTADGVAQPNGDVRLLNPWPSDVSSLLRAAADEIDRVSQRQTSTTVHFDGGPWNGETTDLEQIVAPVFSPAHEIGKNYWLDTKGRPGKPPTYHWIEPTT